MKYKFLNLLLTFLVVPCLAGVISGQSTDVSIDTIIYFDPETYEETIMVVQTTANDTTVLAAPGETTAHTGDELYTCYTFIFGSLPFNRDRMTDDKLSMKRDAVLSHLQRGIKIAAHTDCVSMTSDIDYVMQVQNGDGGSMEFTADQVQDYVETTPGMFERIVLNASTLTFRNVEVKLEDDSVAYLGDFTVKVIE